MGPFVVVASPREIQQRRSFQHGYHPARLREIAYLNRALRQITRSADGISLIYRCRSLALQVPHEGREVVFFDTFA
jgi:hypothetical protein